MIPGPQYGDTALYGILHNNKNSEYFNCISLRPDRFEQFEIQKGIYSIYQYNCKFKCCQKSMTIYQYHPFQERCDDAKVTTNK